MDIGLIFKQANLHIYIYMHILPLAYIYMNYENI